MQFKNGISNFDIKEDIVPDIYHLNSSTYK